VIKVLPWARGYLYLQSRPGTVLFSTTRTEKRDALGFKWAGPIKTNKIVLLARRDAKIRISSVEEAKKYRIGSIIKDIEEHLLISAGIKESNLTRVSTLRSLVRMLEADRIQLAAKGWENLMGALKTEKYNLDDYEIAFELKSSHQYFAFHKATPDHIVIRFQNAIDNLKDQHEAIIRKFR
jgi:polar amino acid transport system substrate-binding protein